MEWIRVVRTQLLDPLVEQNAQISYMIERRGKKLVTCVLLVLPILDEVGHNFKRRLPVVQLLRRAEKLVLVSPLKRLFFAADGLAK